MGETKAQPPSGADWAVIWVALVLPTVVTWVYFIALDGAAAVLQQTAYGVGKAIQFSLPVVWVFLVRRERLNLTAPNSRGFLAGGAFGLLVAAGIVGLYFLALKPAGMLAGPAEAVRRYEVTREEWRRR